MIFILVLILSSAVYSQEKLEEIYMIELGRLEETWNILDQYAEKICHRSG